MSNIVKTLALISSEYSSAYIGALKANKKILVNTRLMMSDGAQAQ